MHFSLDIVKIIMQTETTPPWLRMLQIVIGSISVLLSAIILILPYAGIATIIILLSVVLLILGIERIGFGAIVRFQSNSARITNITLGVAVIAIAIFLLEFPIFTVGLLITLAAIALLVAGIARIVHSIRIYDSKKSRTISISIGIFCVAISSFIIANPIDFGVMLLILVLSAGLLIVGISMVIRGIKPERYEINELT
ncbi:MAG: DUF308 domain-containing protein [Nitrososphaeraceae archaeon]|nr:DUF308 domain-containing protein [Nitrososphaeraceae archaeon]